MGLDMEITTQPYYFPVQVQSIHTWLIDHSEAKWRTIEMFTYHENDSFQYRVPMKSIGKRQNIT